MITHSVRAQLRPAIVLTAVLMVVTGAAYPGVVTALAQLLFPAQANGSLVRQGGVTVGSALIAQRFTDSGYFHARPSAAGDSGYDATASSGTNKGPTDRAYTDTMLVAEVARAVHDDGATPGAIPADYVTRSASGLDPDVSPAAAALQVPRVARVRGVDAARISALVAAHTTGRQFGLLGEPRVNVLLLNLALDSLAPRATRGATSPNAKP